MDFKSWLLANGYDTEALEKAENAKQRKHLEAAYKAELKACKAQADEEEEDGEEDDDEAAKAGKKPKVKAGSFVETMDAIEAETARQHAIQEIAANYARQNVGNPDKVKGIREMANAAIQDSKTSVQSFQLAMLRYDRHAGQFVMAPREQQLTSSVVEAAICRHGGLKDIDKSYSAQTLEVSEGRFRNGIGLQELIGLCAAQNGYRGNVRRDLRGALRAAFGSAGGSEMMAVGPSTLDITSILSNVANKFVREAFLFVEDAWRRITATRSVNDFKQISSYSLTGDMTYEEVAPGGELKHGSLGEETYNNQAKTYGKLLGIDRRDMINDDLGALTQVNRRLGRGGALKLCEVFWTTFLANSSFFTSGRGNYDDGAADTLMDLTGLANAHTLFMLLNDPDGKPTGTTPKIVLVPPQLWPAAWTLLKSENLNLATATAASTGTKSPWTGMFDLVSSRYLANSSFTGSSASAWYLLADPNDMPVIETCFLNGNEMPTIETADLDFDRLGIALRGYHDFGVALQEYRGGVKMKGAA
jgi:hypothetical protein